MATYQDYNPSKCNDFMTPDYVWDWIIDYIPKDKVIWEPFYGDGKSGEYLKSKGLNVIHENIDFFENNKGEIVVSNPPFEKKKEIINRLVELDKPFILIMPVSTLCYNYAKVLKDDLQIIIPKKRIKFKRYDKKTNTIYKDWEKHNNTFDCLFYCYKMKLDKDIIFLN
jgi:hypothetical protein